MSDLLQQIQADERPCPVCGVPAEPDCDGDHSYYECENDDCDAPGYTWGYQRSDESTRIAGSCQLGVPESIRRSASAGMEGALAGQAQSAPTFITATIGRRPE